MCIRDSVWTLNATNSIFKGHRTFNYVYVNGSIVDYINFLVTYSVVNSTNLKIYNIYPTDNGFYDCYKTNGERITGYYVIAKGMLFPHSKEQINHDSFVCTVCTALSVAGGAENARIENARMEKAAPNCRGGNRESGKRGTKTAGVENARMENAGT